MMAIGGGQNSDREGANQTLADVLNSKEKPEFVRPRHTVREAASVIAAQKKAVLVVEDGELVGIFTPRDMLNRVIAKVGAGYDSCNDCWFVCLCVCVSVHFVFHVLISVCVRDHGSEKAGECERIVLVLVALIYMF